MAKKQTDAPLDFGEDWKKEMAARPVVTKDAKVVACAKCGKPTRKLGKQELAYYHVKKAYVCPDGHGQFVEKVKARFYLGWASVENAVDRTGTWQLQPTTSEDFKYATKNLNHEWVDGVQAMLSRRDVFVFRGGKAMLSVVLNNLATSGIPASGILVMTPVPPELGPIFDEKENAANAGG